ncbi:MAG: hypothetical protein WAJ85_06035 [Candidatus Baltobacteraceae bacterium]|jgi:hypothetical protein
MNGIVVYESLAAALRDGYHVFDRTSDGYVIRIRTARGWALALAKPSAHESTGRL